MYVFLIMLCLAIPMSGAERLPEDRGAAGLLHSLKQLSTEARILYVTAHPDDEDPALLTYLSRGVGAHVTMLILNRGEGGANVVSGNFFEELGALRTVEMWKAAQYYGVDVRFTRAVDYGYSKNMGEALRQWKEADLLADVLRITREVRPHVIISRFNESERDGHGHHQTAGRMAKRAFQEAGTPTWFPLKLYTSNWREGEAVTLKLNTGEYDAVLGRSYAQIGRDGYRWHRSQGMAGNVPRPGPVWAYLKLEGSRVGSPDSEQSVLERIPHAVREESLLEARRLFDALHPERCAPALARAWAQVPARRTQIAKALALSLGLELEALVEPDVPITGPFAMFRSIETLQVAQPGQTIPVKMVLHQRGNEAVLNVKYGVKGPVEIGAVAPNGTSPLRILPTAQPTSAFWQRASVRDAMYTLADMKLLGNALPDSGIRATASFEYMGATPVIEAEFETSSVDPRIGAQRQALAIGPPVSLQFDSSFGLVPIGNQNYELTLKIQNLSTKPQKGEVQLRLPPGFSLVGPAPTFALAKEKEEVRLPLKLRLADSMTSQDYQVEATALIDGKSYSTSFQAITQPGFRVLYWSQLATHRLRAVDAKLATGLRVGYVMGSGDEVPEGLRQLGVPVELLDESKLAQGDLRQYSTILIGIRAYAAREDLKRHNARLLDYVKQGGALVVQYQTQEYDRNFGPYPYTQGRGAEETSEEDAPVKILRPERDAFRYPNRITAQDFEGWVEQRGSKFFATWDKAWTPMVETHDVGQAPQEGVWLEARYGKGLYVYCSLAWYRQLPFAVPGAARIFANLVSLGAADAPWRKEVAQ